jgi:hypothetical protein
VEKSSNFDSILLGLILSSLSTISDLNKFEGIGTNFKEEQKQQFVSICQKAIKGGPYTFENMLIYIVEKLKEKRTYLFDQLIDSLIGAENLKEIPQIFGIFKKHCEKIENLTETPLPSKLFKLALKVPSANCLNYIILSEDNINSLSAFTEEILSKLLTSYALSNQLGKERQEKYLKITIDLINQNFSLIREKLSQKFSTFVITLAIEASNPRIDLASNLLLTYLSQLITAAKKDDCENGEVYAFFTHFLEAFDKEIGLNFSKLFDISLVGLLADAFYLFTTNQTLYDRKIETIALEKNERKSEEITEKTIALSDYSNIILKIMSRAGSFLGPRRSLKHSQLSNYLIDFLTHIRIYNKELFLSQVINLKVLSKLVTNLHSLQPILITIEIIQAHSDSIKKADDLYLESYLEMMMSLSQGLIFVAPDHLEEAIQNLKKIPIKIKEMVDLEKNSSNFYCRYLFLLQQQKIWTENRMLQLKQENSSNKAHINQLKWLIMEIDSDVSIYRERLESGFKINLDKEIYSTKCSSDLFELTFLDKLRNLLTKSFSKKKLLELFDEHSKPKYPYSDQYLQRAALLLRDSFSSENHQQFAEIIISKVGTWFSKDEIAVVFFETFSFLMGNQASFKPIMYKNMIELLAQHHDKLNSSIYIDIAEALCMNKENTKSKNNYDWIYFRRCLLALFYLAITTDDFIQGKKSKNILELIRTELSEKFARQDLEIPKDIGSLSDQILFSHLIGFFDAFTAIQKGKLDLKILQLQFLELQKWEVWYDENSIEEHMKQLYLKKSKNIN